MLWLPFVLLASVIAVATYLRQWLVPYHERTWVAAVLATVLGVAPFLLPERWLIARTLLTGFAMTLSIKIRLLLDREEVDPSITAHTARFVLWFLLPPATHWPRTAWEAAAAGKEARKRLRRFLVKTPLFLVTLVVKLKVPGLPWPVTALLTGLEFYLFLSGLADLLSGLVMLGGVQVKESFASPLLARSPGEFWGTRWNLFVGVFARLHVFYPLARRGWGVATVAVVFVCSGLMHEYLVAACLGLRRYQPGFMLAFFSLQVPAVLLTRWLSRMRLQVPAALAIAGQTAWMTLTVPLFFRPLAPLVDAFDNFWTILLPVV